MAIDSKSRPLVLFGDRDTQSELLRLAGAIDAPYTRRSPTLRRSGLITSVNGQVVLDYRHPAFGELWEILAELSRTRFLKERFAVPTRGLTIDYDCPLGHANRYAFRILVQVARAAAPTSLDVLRNSIPDASRAVIRRVLAQLEVDRVLTLAAEGCRFSDLVPEAFGRAVLVTAAYLARTDKRYAVQPAPVSQQLSANMRNRDGAPRLFGPDRRLRNLMALAVKGPMVIADLRRASGTEGVPRESRSNAPFGRGAVVRVWESPHGIAAALDPEFPAAHELQRLLKKMATTYKLPPFKPHFPTPDLPIQNSWNGDRHALFWGPLNTSILMTIGSVGWGFEALFVRSAPGYARESVKKAMRRLEDEGVIVADKARKPGFSPRILRLAPRFVAHDELRALLARCLVVWPSFGARAFAALWESPSKTLAYLHGRGLIKRKDKRFWQVGKPKKTSEEIRAGCLSDYRSLCETRGASLTAHDIIVESPGLYKRILTNWGGMAAFREAAGVPPRILVGTKTSPDPALRERCIREYRALAEHLGENPTSLTLTRKGGGLYDRIVKAWGSFPSFYKEVGCAPARTRRDGTWSIAAIKAECVARYRLVEQSLGRPPASMEIGIGLQKRIYMAWGSFPAFLVDIGSTRPLFRTFPTLEKRRAYCVDAYLALQRTLGHPPSSTELQRRDPALLGHIKHGWGGFIPFCQQTQLRQPRICANQIAT